MIAVPNVSEGRDSERLMAIHSAFCVEDVIVLALTADLDHNRAVVTLMGSPAALGRGIAAGARVAADLIDLTAHEGVHPFVGAVDVAPFVYLDESERGLACAAALTAADRIGEQGLPVFLYGELAGGRTRAELRRGGPAELARRVRAGELAPDFGPGEVDPRHGAVLVAARPPLVAFNVELSAGHTLAQAQAIARLIRAGGAEGLPGVRALGLYLKRRDVVQISTNIEDTRAVTATDVVAAVRRHAAVAGAELVAPAPAAAFDGFPDDVPCEGRGLARL